MRWIETYGELLRANIYSGVLHPEFVCQEVVPLCYAYSYSMLSLHDYIDDIISKYKESTDDNVIDTVYGAIKDLPDSPKTIRILHLSDLNIDPYYVPGASVKCREFRCCHAKNNKIPQTDPLNHELGEDLAGPFGARGCDQSLGAAQTLLEKLKQEQEDHYPSPSHPSIIVVTGGVVSDQPGQMNKIDHENTIINTYNMIREVFPTSVIYPVLGSQDFWPTNYFRFNRTTEYDNYDYWNYDTEYKYQLEQEDMMSNLKTHFASLTLGIDLQDDGYYCAENVYKEAKPTEIPDSQGNILDHLTTYSYEPWAKTYFFALNTQACFMVNSALFEQFGDPGGQLAMLEEKLLKARDTGNMMIIAGNISPGHPSCNR